MRAQGGAETSFGVKRIVVRAKKAQVFGGVWPAVSPRALVIELEERASLAAAAVGRGEAALQTVALGYFAPDLMWNVGAGGSGGGWGVFRL